MSTSRRDFIKTVGISTAAAGLSGLAACTQSANKKTNNILVGKDAGMRMNKTPLIKEWCWLTL